MGFEGGTKVFECWLELEDMVLLHEDPWETDESVWG